MRDIVKLGAVIAGLVLASTTAGAQGAPGRTTEFGIDGAITFRLYDGDHLNTIDLPNPVFRIGFHRNPTWSIEPYGQIHYESTENTSGSTILLGAGVLYHFSTSRLENQWYVRPFMALDHTSFNIDGGPDGSTNQLQLGAGFGLKMPLADRVGARFEVNLGRALESGNDVPGYTIIGLQAGLSYYTR